MRISDWSSDVCSSDLIILARFAESIRRGIAACDHSETVGERLVTASVGVAEVRPACDFKQLYRLADEALYDAKRGGRNRIAVQRRQSSAGRAYGRGGVGRASCRDRGCESR